MKILKYVRSILLDVIKIAIGIGALLLLLGVVGLFAFGVLFVIAGSSGLVSSLFDRNEYVLYGCMFIWVIGLFSFFTGSNPIKDIKEMFIAIKNYFIKRWNEIN